jgi:hypothetical protein
MWLSRADGGEPSSYRSTRVVEPEAAQAPSLAFSYKTVHRRFQQW